MLYVPSSRYAQRSDNWGTNPSNTPGTSIVPGASNAEGCWTLALYRGHQPVGPLVPREQRCDLDRAEGPPHGYRLDPAGGTSLYARISNIVCGQCGTTSSALSGHQFFFPIFVPSGADIAVRIQGSNATAGTVLVQVRAYGYATRPSAMPAGQYSETIGTITGSAGVTFAPAVNSLSSWVSLGTTTRDLWWWQLAYGISNCTSTVERTYIEMGVGDSTNKSTIIARSTRASRPRSACPPSEEPDLARVLLPGQGGQRAMGTGQLRQQHTRRDLPRGGGGGGWLMLYMPSCAYYARVDNWGTNPAAIPGDVRHPRRIQRRRALDAGPVRARRRNVYGIYVRVGDGTTSGQQKDHLLDLGTDPAGGSAYTARISNIVCGEQQARRRLSRPPILLPPLHPRGRDRGRRIQGNNATAGTVRVMVKAYTARARPGSCPCGQYSETLGTITNSQGVTFTPGNSAEGTLVSLGTTARDLWWWQLAYQLSNGTITTEKTYIKLYYGPSGSQIVIHELMHIGNRHGAAPHALSLEPALARVLRAPEGGHELWVNGRCDSPPDTGYNAVAIGIGG